MKYVCQTMENFEKLSGEMDVVIFGAGDLAMRFMNRIGDLTDRIKYIATNNKSKIGGTLYGIPIVSPDVLKTMDEDRTLVMIAARSPASEKELYEQTLSMGNYTIMMVKVLINPVTSAVAEAFYTHQKEIHEVYEMLFDDLSKEIYREAIRRRAIYGDFDFTDLQKESGSEYCPTLWFSDHKPENEVILDCGACEGDTLTKFARVYGPKVKRIYSFECMPQSLIKLGETAASLSNMEFTPEVVILPYALSDHEGKMVFASMEQRPGGSFIMDNRSFAKTNFIKRNEIEVAVSTIDKLIPKDEKVTQIKMDIEGSEYGALLGARETILRCKPKLAISIYHCGEDYYRLPLLVKEMVPEYKIAVRHHRKNCWDTDMYCWI